MSFPRDAYPYTNFHELNLGYFIVHFREIFSQWADLYDQMTDWKDATDEELAAWKTGVEADLVQRETALRAELETWKAQTGQDIAGWEDATLTALTAWQTATQAVFEAIRVEAAGSATAAAASATQAATAKTAAETAQAAAEAAAASVQASAAQITTNTEDIADLKTQITSEYINLEMIAKPSGKNLFDAKQFNKNGITVSDGVFSGSGTEWQSLFGSDTDGFFIFGNFESNQQYTLSFKVRNASTTGQSGHGLYIYVLYTDNSTDRLVVGRNYTSFTAVHLTSAASKTIKKYYISVAQSPTIEWEIKEIYVEKGSTYTSYEDFELTAVDDGVEVLRTEINAELQALDAKKPDNISFELLDTENVPKSPNLWDNTNTKPGWINTSGNKVMGFDETHCHFRISGLSQGDVLTSYTQLTPTSTAMRVITAYNADGEAVSASGAESVGTYTVPSGVVAVIVTEEKTYANNYWMIVKNAESTPLKYYPYYEQHIDYLASPEFLKNINLGVKIIDEPVYEKNIVALENTSGAVLANGTVITEGTYTGYKYSQKLSVSAGDIITPISSTGENNPYFRFLCAYSGNTVNTSAGSNSSTYEYTVPEGIDGVIVTTSPSYNINSVKIKHKTGTIERTIPINQKLGKFNWKGNLSDGDSVELLSSNVRFNVVWNFTGHVTTMGKIIIGNKDASGTVTELLSVDATNVYYKAPSGDVTAPHGLTISGDIAIRIECDLQVNYLKGITVTSLGESFSVADNTAYSREMYGSPYLESDGSVMTDCVFSWIPQNIDKPIWVFGDSWVSMYDSRWPYYMKQAGYTNDWLLNGFAGENTKEAFESFQNLLTIRKPDYVVWLLGMNDKDNGAVNANWKTVYDKLTALCEEYEIMLILYTVPNTPTIDNSYKNAIVEASGYRYIDGAAAVGDDGSGNWFTGYEQSESDHNHTSSKGAKALFHRILGDFPEIAGNGV